MIEQALEKFHQTSDDEDFKKNTQIVCDGVNKIINNFITQMQGYFKEHHVHHLNMQIYIGADGNKMIQGAYHRNHDKIKQDQNLVTDIQ